MDKRLLPHHMEELRGSGLSDETIEALGFYSGTAAEVKDILGFDAGPGLVIPYPTYEGAQPFSRVKPDQPPIIDGKPAKYLSRKDAIVRAYIPPQTWQALKDARAMIIVTEGEKKAAKADQEEFFCIGEVEIWGFQRLSARRSSFSTRRGPQPRFTPATQGGSGNLRDMDLRLSMSMLTKAGFTPRSLRYPSSSSGCQDPQLKRNWPIEGLRRRGCENIGSPGKMLARPSAKNEAATTT
jgi:hypothetical protein